MMRKQLAILFILTVWLAAGGGCALYQPMQFQPVKKANAIAPKFSQSYYYYDRDQTLYFILRNNTTDPVSRKPVEQVTTIRVFWRPVGGVTTLDPSALNATFRYIVMTPDAVGMYEGAGFVRLSQKTGAAKLEGRFMDGDMRLTQASAGFVDTIGRARVTGWFSGKNEDVKAMDAWLGAQREFFARSLDSKPAGAATAPATEATEPSTQPAAAQP